MANRFITLTEVSASLSNPSRTTVVLNIAHVLYVIPDQKRNGSSVWMAGGRVFEVEESFQVIQKEFYEE